MVRKYRHPNMRERRLPMLLLFSFLFFGAGDLYASGTAESKGRNTGCEAEAETGTTFAIVYPIVHPFFEPVTKMAIEYGLEQGIRVITKAPESMNIQQQIDIVEDLIESKVDGLAVCATDPSALTPLVNKAIEQGIPTITFESDMPQSRRICFLGTDNFKAGQHLAEVVARELDYRGKAIICTGLPTQLSLNQRIEGIKDTLRKKYPDISIPDISTGKGDPDLTLQVIQRQIAEIPDFDVFISIDATGGPVAVSIWKAKGWKGDRHKIITFDDMPNNIAGIRVGIVTSVISQKQWTWGPLIIDRLIDIRSGKDVPDYFDTGTVEITIDNIDTYRK